MLRLAARAAAPLRVPSLRQAAVAARPMVAACRRGMSTFEAADDIDVDSVSYGFMASQAVFTGLEVGLYEHIAAAGEGGLTLPALQQKCGISDPRLQTLITALTSIKSLKRDAATGAYTLSPNSAKFLVQTSRAYYGDYLRYQMGRQFYHRMGALPDVMTSGEAPSYASWFSDPETANTYTQAQHNGSVATAKYLVKKKLSLEGAQTMLDVGGGSGAFSCVPPACQHMNMHMHATCTTCAYICTRRRAPPRRAAVPFVWLRMRMESARAVSTGGAARRFATSPPHIRGLGRRVVAALQHRRRPAA